MPVSPLAAADTPVCVAVLADGSSLPDTAALLSITVRCAVNDVPSATLVFAAGDRAEGSVALADADTLAPGTEITLKAGHGSADAVLFSGRIVSQRLSIHDDDIRLLLECRDKAHALTVGRSSALYRNQRDADIAAALAAAHGLKADITGLDRHHEQLVQQDCSDWDFLLERARANACLVTVNAGQLTVAEPVTDGSAALKLTCGEDLIAFDAASVPPHAARPALPPALCIRGRARFQGSALARAGELIELAGVGRVFGGQRLITSVTHDLAEGAWTTEVGFGPPWPDAGALHASPASPALPVTGLQLGRVLRRGGDPAGDHRILVQLPAFGDQGLWAPLMQFKASKGAGACFVPEIDDEVLVGFLAGDPGRPVVVGSFYSRARPPAASPAPEGARQSIVTRTGTRLEFDDEHRAVTVATPDGRTLVLSDEDGSISLSDRAGNRVTLAAAGISLQSPKDVHIEAGGDVAISALGTLTLGAAGDASLSGLNLRCKAQVGLTAQGVASAELSAAGQTTVKGSLVFIN